jgi:sulfotransferase family protein
MNTKKPILVTGAHRSGSTWVGRMLSEAPGVAYIHEPFSVTDRPGVGICSARFPYWFTYITRNTEVGYYQDMRKTIEFKYNWRAALQSCRSVADLRNVKEEYTFFLTHRRHGSRPLLKDPLALFSAAWMADRFNMDVVVIIRHPAAFVSSIKKLNWAHPFSHFLKQSLLMETVLSPFAAEIREYATREHSITDQAILLWRLLYYMTMNYQRQHREWIFVRHEDLSQDPLTGFTHLYERLDLEFSSHVREKVLEYSSSTNPADTDAPVGSDATLKRNSRENMWNWKNRLTPTEIKTIRERVEDISKAFYTNEDW